MNYGQKKKVTIVATAILLKRSYSKKMFWNRISFKSSGEIV
jgi:hypothetical protein